MSIDWEDLRIGFNRIKNTDFKTVKDLIDDLSSKHTQKESANILGVGLTTLRRKKDSFKHPKIVRPKSLLNIKETFLTIPDEELKYMTALEISKKLYCSDKYARNLCYEFKKDFLQVLNMGEYHASKTRVKKGLSVS